jgi:hypothetical protein
VKAISSLGVGSPWVSRLQPQAASIEAWGNGKTFQNPGNGHAKENFNFDSLFCAI